MSLERVSICAECGASLEKVELIVLALTYEVDEQENDMFEQVWHRTCLVAHDRRQSNKPNLPELESGSVIEVDEADK